MIQNMITSPLVVASLVLWASLSGTRCDLFAQAHTQVPFVGCESDGQVGPLKAPQGKAKRLALPAKIAGRLAYYKAEEGFGVLAPRGWQCFSTYGSNGSNLYVAPEPMNGKMLLLSDWNGFTGQAVQVSVSAGNTSGRFAVARVIARVFPDRKEFVQSVIAERIEPAAAFPSGPYPTDRLTYLSRNVVEFETPPNSKGLGTDSMLLVSSTPIRGVAILFGEEPSLVEETIRLSAENQTLIRAILEQTEKEAAGSKSK